MKTNITNDRLKREPFIWSRQFSMEQFDKMNRIGTIRRWMMDKKTIEMSRFCSCQPAIFRTYNDCGSSSEGLWDGKKVKFRISVRPLFVEYALAVYRQALLDTHVNYPGFDRHYFEDGPLVGERRIVFPDKLDYVAALWLYWRFDELDRNDVIKVSESFTVSPAEHQWSKEQMELDVVVVLDKPVIEWETCKEIEKALEEGAQYLINPDLKKCSLEPFENDPLVNVSLPELVYLNWDLARKPSTPLEAELFAAIGTFDYTRVKKALESGANPNALSDETFPDPPLGKAVDFKWCEKDTRTEGTDYEEHTRKHPGPSPAETIAMVDLLVAHGATVDWASLNEMNALSKACLSSDAEVIRHLLELGADPSIRCFDDSSPWGVGTPWDYAFDRCEPMSNNNDESAEKAIMEKWKLPFEDVILKAKPSINGDPAIEKK